MLYVLKNTPVEKKQILKLWINSYGSSISRCYIWFLTISHTYTYKSYSCIFSNGHVVKNFFNCLPYDMLELSDGIWDKSRLVLEALLISKLQVYLSIISKTKAKMILYQIYITVWLININLFSVLQWFDTTTSSSTEQDIWLLFRTKDREGWVDGWPTEVYCQPAHRPCPSPSQLPKPYRWGLLHFVDFFQFATFLLVLDIVDFFIVSVVW